MPILVKMPKWGLTMKAGTITQWLRAEGAAVAAGEPLLTVETDKAANEVEAPEAGVLRKIVAPEGAEVPVSDPLAVLAAPGETLGDDDVAAFLEAIAQEKHSAVAQRAGTGRVAREERAAARDEEGRLNASPAARKLARELGLDLATVSATGPGGRITSDDVERAAAAAAETREDYVSLPDGRRIFYVLAGPLGATPLVFLHGLGGSQSTWQTVLGDLAATYRVCALDLPGHGQSDKPAPGAADYSLGSLAGAVVGALEALALRDAVLVGHSLGGAVAITVALGHPDRVSRLVLVDSAGLGDEINPEMLDRIEAAPSRAESRLLLELFFRDKRYVLESGIEDNYQGRLAPGADDAVRAVASAAGFSRAGQRTGLPARLGELRRPVLIVWGAEDRVIPAGHATAAARTIDGARVEVFPQTGHVPQIEAASAFVRAVTEFVPAPAG